jgi:hypothetical protein
MDKERRGIVDNRVLFIWKMLNGNQGQHTSYAQILKAFRSHYRKMTAIYGTER